MHRLYARSQREAVDDAAGTIAAGVMAILSANDLILYKRAGSGGENREAVLAGLASVFRPHLQMVRAVYDKVSQDLASGVEETSEDSPGGSLMGVLWRAYLRRVHPHRDFSAPDAKITALKADYARALTKILTERAVRKILSDVDDLPDDATTQAGVVGLFPRRVTTMTARSGDSVIAYREWPGQYFNPETTRQEKINRFVTTGKLSNAPQGQGNLLTREKLEEMRKELTGKYRAILRGRSMSGRAFYITSDGSLFIDEGSTYEEHLQELQSGDVESSIDFEFIKRVTAEELAAKRVKSFTTRIESREEREASAVTATPEQLRRLRSATSDEERAAINREIEAYRQAQSAQKKDEEIPVVEINQQTSKRVTDEIVSSFLLEDVRVRINSRVAFADKRSVTFVAQAKGLRALRLDRSEVALILDPNAVAQFLILPPPPPVKEEIARVALQYLTGIFDDEGFPAADVIGGGGQQKK